MKNSSPKPVKVFCGELCRSNDCTATKLNLLNRKIRDIEPNITIGYDKFVNDPENLPSRILDLLQISAYIFCADRLISRGKRDSLDNKPWGRSFEFHIPVLDYDFWNNQSLQRTLADAITFMTGDRKYAFIFEKSALGHLPKIEYKQLSLFKDESQVVEGGENADISLFSGGLDSLAGAIERLNASPGKNLLLVSHEANNSVTHTQKEIIKHLQERYENRVLPYGFECHNKRIKSKEETQRSRMFLFSSIAFAICNCANKHNFYVYENGITSINLPIQTDVVNGRASRTTHPKTIGLMQKLFSFFDKDFCIITPYYDKTKEDVLRAFVQFNEKEVLASSVSCSSTRNKPGMMNPHCGCCSQFIDRRFAAYAAKLDDYDAQYTNDFITKIPNDETKQRLYQTLRIASAEKLQTPEELFKNYPDEMSNLIEYWQCNNSQDSIDEIHALFSRYGDSVMRAAKAMQIKHEDLKKTIDKDSLLAMLSNREYLQTPTAIRVTEIDAVLKRSIRQSFHTEKPKNENDFNNKVQALLKASREDFSREYPVLSFGVSSYRADLSNDGLIIESKYIRGKTSPSRATEGIAADITKIPSGWGVLFVVYDPEVKITDDDSFIQSFENKRSACYVRIYR